MEKYRKIFNQYFKRFNIKEPNILRKFHHSYRVMEYAIKIGESLNLNDHDMWLCEFIGLFHDIGRFKQWTDYETYLDSISIDHGNLSCRILEEENVFDSIDDIDKDIIITAIKYHNKYDLNVIKDERTLLFCKIIRDADKLDILFEQGNTISKIEKSISPQLLNEIYNKKLCTNEYVNTDVDIILRQIGFLFDLNFSYSFKILEEKNWIENKFNLIENYVNDKECVTKLKEFINNYIEEMILC